MRKYYGSDDGYDYAKDNRDGDVDAYVAWVKEWRKAQDEKKVEVPQKQGQQTGSFQVILDRVTRKGKKDG